MNQGRFDNLIENKNEQLRMLLLIMAAFSLETIVRYVVIVVTKLPVVSAFSPMFKPAMYTCLIFMNYKSWIGHKVKGTDVLFVLFFFFSLMVSYLAFPNTREYVLQQKNTLFMVVPLFYLLGVIFTPDKKTMETLGFLGKVIIFVDILFSIYWGAAGNELGEDAMYRAYSLLPSVLFSIMCAFNRSKPLDWMWMIFASIYIFTCGTRGPIIVIAAYLVYCLLIKNKSSSGKKFFYVILVFGFVGFYYSPFFDMAIQGLAGLFEQIGVSTRIFDHMLGDTLISDTSGRDEIYVKVYKLLHDNPLGYGILGEYQFLGWNTHNFYLQIFMHYGIPFGTVLLVVVLAIIFSAVKNNPNVYAKDFIALWFCVTFVRGFAGGSYLTYYFPFLLGLAINEIRNKKKLYKTLVITEEGEQESE